VVTLSRPVGQNGFPLPHLSQDCLTSIQERLRLVGGEPSINSQLKDGDHPRSGSSIEAAILHGRQGRNGGFPAKFTEDFQQE
jgi:hypothetical protein